MLNLFIHGMELALIAMIVYLVYKMYLLSISTEPVEMSYEITLPRFSNIKGKQVNRLGESFHDSYELKQLGLQKAQVFTTLELAKLKHLYGDLDWKKLTNLKDAVAFYLIGAIDLIMSETDCPSDNRDSLIEMILKINLKLSPKDTCLYLSEQVLPMENSDKKHMIKAGYQAAKLWLQHKSIPTNVSLAQQLSRYELVATS